MGGPYRSLGGLPRGFGLHRGFEQDDAPPIPLSGPLVRRVIRQMRPYRWWWVAILSCVAVSSALGVLPPLLVKSILDHAIPDKNPHLLFLMVGAMVGLTVVSSFIGVLQSYLTVRVGQGLMFDLRTQLYRHLQRQSLGFYTVTRAGEILSRVSNDVGAVLDISTSTPVSIASNAFTLVFTLIVIFSMNPWLALLAIAIVPTFYLPTRTVGRIRRNLARRTQEQQAELVAFMEERLNIGGMLLTKLFGQAQTEADTFAEHNLKVMDLNLRSAIAGRWLFMCLAIFSVLGPAAIYGYGGMQAIHGVLTVGTIIAFVAYLASLYRPVGQLAEVYTSLQAALAVFERIYDYLDREPEVDDAPDAVELGEVAGDIRFENVSFTYPRRRVPAATQETPADEDTVDRRALKEVSFRIAPGERVALVGPSGAGKTTITYLLPRFYDPTDGCITLDGHDLRGVTQDSLRAQMAAVTQDTFLFHATVRENLVYARPEATEEEIIAACRAANIHDFIMTLPDNYDTVVGERGFRLSGGEKQRLAMARALLKDPRILILDEATSNLDATSEYLIQQALETLLRGRTSLIIAHRLSTILGADKIVVLDHGRVVESGKHAELLAANGLYAQLYHQQFEKVINRHDGGGLTA